MKALFGSTDRTRRCPVSRPSLSGSGGHPMTVAPGETFEVRRGVTIKGQKIVHQLEACCRPSHPFGIPRGHRRRHTRLYLEPDEEGPVSFTARAHVDARPGKDRLLTAVVTGITQP